MKLAHIGCLVLTLLTSGLSTANAQNAGVIVGAVQDNTGAVIPGATVIVTKSGGAAQTATSDETGQFRVEALLPGMYSLTVSVPGFADYRTDVLVSTGQTVRVDVSLSPASQTSSVKVEGQGPTQVEQEAAHLLQVITGHEVVTYALNGRNFTQLIALAPGVSNQTGQDEALVGVKGSVKYSVNGGRVEYNSYDVDGGDILNASINGNHSTLIVYPSIDAIDELRVLTSNYGAMYGRSASGTILATTKSGGNEFHGTGYFFARNNVFNARNFFDQTRRAPLYEKYEPGGTLGGPLYIPGLYNTKKDKTFFFASEEYRHDSEPIPYNQAVPTLAQRNCQLDLNRDPNSFDAQVCQDPTLVYGLASRFRFGPGTVFGSFSDVCPAASTGQVLFARSQAAAQAAHVAFAPDCPGAPTPTVAAGQTIYQAFPGNLVPIDPRSAAILNTGLIPAPNSPTGCNSSLVGRTDAGSSSAVMPCYTASISPLTTWREDLFRIDHNFSAREKIYFRYIHDSWSTVVTTPQWGVVHNSFPTVQNQFTGPGTSLITHFTSTVSNRLVNDVAMSYTTDHITITDIPGPGLTSSGLQRPSVLNNPPCVDAFTYQIDKTLNCGLGYFFNNGFGGKIPGIVIAGTNAAYGGKGFAVDPGYMPWRHSNPTYSPRDDATLALGKHTLQFGALFIIAQRNEINPPVGANIGDLQGLATFSNVNNLNTTGNAFADFLVPNIQTFQQDSAQHVYHNNYRIAEPYFQDDWKIGRRLTLNLGIRFSLFGAYHEKNLTSYNWVPAQFNSKLASEVSVATLNGYLVKGPYALGTFPPPVPLDVNNIDPHLVNGIVRCGVDKYADGTRVPASCMTDHVFNPAPRIGFAFDPFGTGKTSMRAGYGIFYEHGTGNEANTGSLEGSVGNAGAGGVLNMTQYYPQDWGCLGNAAAQVAIFNCNRGGSAFPLNITSIPTRAVWPYVQQWSFSVQRELPKNTLLSAAYVGSKGTHLTAELQVNQLLPVNPAQNPFNAGQPLTASICQQFNQGVFLFNGLSLGPGAPAYSNLLAACTGLNKNIPVPDALRVAGAAIAPSLGQVFSLQNIANSSYHAFQFTMRHVKGPLTLGLSYTYSHSIDNSSDRTEAILPNPYNIRQNRASSDFDQRHLLNVSYIYQLPLFSFAQKAAGWFDDPSNELAGKGLSEAHAKLLFDGWELSGITLYSSGTPFSVVNGGSTSGISGIDNAGVASGPAPDSYPDLATPQPKPALGPGGGVIGPLIGNPTMFVAPTGLTYGNAGRNFMNNPSRINFDIALAKHFKLTEAKSLQFRFETFNTFNHTQFRIYDPSNPGSTGNNVITCYAGDNNSAGDSSCLNGASFLHPVDAHRPRTIQLGVKFLF